MPPEESFEPKDWLRIAGKDLKRVTQALRLRDSEMAGFYLQQAVEKCLKAYLLSRGWKLERTHSLEALLDVATDHDPTLEEFRTTCQRITGFYFLERYPFVRGEPATEADVRTSLREARLLIRRLRAPSPRRR